ncbi:hypothetical protein LSAT2_029061 [Lamellibrachia satsuma]|nr:hypothetical protein LSAT2_029061 [Lamellibrachia satsuma]
MGRLSRQYVHVYVSKHDHSTNSNADWRKLQWDDVTDPVVWCCKVINEHGFSQSDMFRRGPEVITSMRHQQLKTNEDKRTQ